MLFKLFLYLSALKKKNETALTQGILQGLGQGTHAFEPYPIL